MILALTLVAPMLLDGLGSQVQHPTHDPESALGDATVYALPEGGKPARVPFQFVGNQVRVDATIDGKGPFHLILDTGMPIPGVLLFENEGVSALHLADSGQRVAVAGAGGDGGTTDALMASGLSVTMADLKMTHVSALVVPEPAGFTPGLDGVVGGALFFHYVVRIDIDQSRLELSEPAGWTPPSGASVVPIVRRNGMAFVDVRVAIGAEELLTAQVVVDIGAGHALSLNTREDGRFAPPAKSIDAQLGRGMSGVLVGKVGRARRVELGTFAFENVVTSFPIGKHQNPGGGDFRDGNLGEEILKHFNVTFDYAGKRMVLEKAKGFGEPFEHEMAGCSFDWEKDGTLAIRAVLPDSPAAVAGIEAGDHLLSIDGKTIEALGETGLRKALIIDGAELTLTLKRGPETIEKKVRLKRLV